MPLGALAADSKKSFEVASVKPSTPISVGDMHNFRILTGPRFGPGTEDATRWVCDNCSLGMLLARLTESGVADGLGSMFPGYQVKPGTYAFAAAITLRPSAMPCPSMAACSDMIDEFIFIPDCDFIFFARAALSHVDHVGKSACAAIVVS